MISSPSGFSVLEYDDATGQGNTASLTDGKGRATFSGLFISDAGEGFVCRFVAFDSTGVGVAWVDSDPFDVAVGEAYAIALSTPVGRMDGGSTFDTPPVIAVQVNRCTSVLALRVPCRLRYLLSSRSPGVLVVVGWVEASTVCTRSHRGGALLISRGCLAQFCCAIVILH